MFSLSPSEGERPLGVGTLCCSDWDRERGPLMSRYTLGTIRWERPPMNSKLNFALFGLL